MALASVQVLPVGLILHELATNAMKHGALSVPNGRVRIGWVVDEREGQRRVRLRWQEQGGPRVTPPADRGFGTRLIEFAVARDLGGGKELTFAPVAAAAKLTRTPIES